MNERFPVKNIQEETLMPKQFTAEDFARAIGEAEREFPIAHILPNRLSTIIEHVQRNLSHEGGNWEKANRRDIEKAITAALRSHNGVIFPGRKRLYRRVVEILFNINTNKSTSQKETQEISPQLRIDLLNTERQRGGDPTD